MARGWLKWTIADLCRASGLAKFTIIRAERGENLHPKTEAAIRHAFEAHGLQFYWPGDAITSGPAVTIELAAAPAAEEQTESAGKPVQPE